MPGNYKIVQISIYQIRGNMSHPGIEITEIEKSVWDVQWLKNTCKHGHENKGLFPSLQCSKLSNSTPETLVSGVLPWGWRTTKICGARQDADAEETNQSFILRERREKNGCSSEHYLLRASNHEAWVIWEHHELGNVAKKMSKQLPWGMHIEVSERPWWEEEVE